MSSNRAFWRALNSLSHPLTIVAIVVLLINDHWLRFEYPSWLTGKLGDFAWLMFAPFIAALIFAWFIPRRLPDQEQLVGLIAFAFIGIWFSLAKTNQQVYTLTVQTLDSLVGWHGTLGMDAADLFTLPALFVGWYIWRAVSNQTHSAKSFAWILLSLGVMGTVATSCAIPIEPTIKNLCYYDGTLFAYGFGGSGVYPVESPSGYLSKDGGRNWKPATLSVAISEKCQETKSYHFGDPWQLEAISATYRFVPGTGIYRAANGQVETLDFDLTEIGHDNRHFYFNKKHSVYIIDPCANYNSNSYDPGPYDAVIDLSTNNLVIAMGNDGILLRTLDGTWSWVEVGADRYIPTSQFDLLTVLRRELLSAFFILFVLLPTLSFRLSTLSTGRAWALFVGWCLLFFITMFVWNFADDVLVPSFATLAIPYFVVQIPLNIYSVRFCWGDKKTLAKILALLFATILLYLLPFLLWARGTVPNAQTAHIFSLLLFLTGVIVTRRYLGRTGKFS